VVGRIPIVGDVCRGPNLLRTLMKPSFVGKRTFCDNPIVMQPLSEAWDFALCWLPSGLLLLSRASGKK